MTTEEPDASPLSRELARIEEIIRTPKMRALNAAGRQVHTGIRPRDAATLVIVQKDGRDTRVLMGKRHHSLKFMPGALVFPGGSVDPMDGMIPTHDDLPLATRRMLMSNMRGRGSARAAKAIGVAAIRELAEECGLLIGKPGKIASHHPDWAPFAERGLAPSISGLSVLARAITPPGPPRRFDTWFMVTTADQIAHTPENGFNPSGELEELQWVRPRDAMEGDTREITRVMLVELMHRLERDPELDPDHPAPFYQSVHRRFQKSMMA
jgi:8-oxo-dGTP pyrophosphatase MutT (NUDIX family)